jgi:hypothetical protein
MARQTQHQPRAARGDSRSVSSHFVEEAMSGQGSPLPDSTRATLEPLFNHSFADVRVFDDTQTHQAASNLNAKAFTVGQNIAFNAGRFAPESLEGQRLLMHELSHTIQQGTANRLPRSLEVSRRDDAGERGARDASSRIAGGFTANVSPSSSVPSVQLEEETEPAPVAPHYELDFARLQASGTTPLGAGSLSGQVNQQGAGFQLKQPDFNVSGGMRDWTKPYLDANGQLGGMSWQGHYDPTRGPSASTQYPFTGGFLNTQLSPSEIAAQGKYGPLSGQASLGAGGFDARAQYDWSTGKAWAGTGGAGVQWQPGQQFSLGGSTDFQNWQANGSYNGNAFGQNFRLDGSASGGTDGSDLSAKARGTLLQPLGLPFNPYGQVQVGPDGTQVTGGLGVDFDLPKF